MSERGEGRITGLAGVLVWTARFEEMLAFYRDTLGLTPRSVKHERGFANFEWGDVRLSIGIHSEVEGTSRDPLRIMVNLSVDDIEAVHKRLVARGVNFLRAPETEEWGGKVATFSDPDGNVVQLFELPAQ